MSTLVMKFGGTSVGSNSALEQVLMIVQRERLQNEHVMIVSSAMGGVTDFLVKLIQSALAGDEDAIAKHMADLQDRHQLVLDHWFDEAPAELAQVQAEQAILFEDLRQSCQIILEEGRASARWRDAVLSMGERLMVRMLAGILRVNNIPAQFVDASQILVTNNQHQNAQPLYEPSLANAQNIILPLFRKNIVPVVTGYIGATAEGLITTLGRGGSDYSATYLASLINADDVWIWTDVNGVMSGDPRKLKNARIIDTISYQAVSEFAYFGAKVLHPRAVEPLITPHIPLRVCNTFNPEHAGTRINSHNPNESKFLNAVTMVSGVLVFAPTLSAEAAEVNSAPPIKNIAEQTLQHIVHQPVAPVITVDSHTGHLLCYVVPTTAHKGATDESVAAIQHALEEAYPDTAWRVESVSIVAAIGVVDVQQTMEVLNAVRSVKAELLAMGHGSPECALLVVHPKQALRVLRKLHQIAVNTHQHLRSASDPAFCPPVPDTPGNRKRNGARNRRNLPPQRSLPL